MAGDLADRAPENLPPSTARSSRHRTGLCRRARRGRRFSVAGADEAGPAMTAGFGRPLILTTLEPAEAMRILAGGTGRPRLVAVLFAVGGTLLVAGRPGRA